MFQRSLRKVNSAIPSFGRWAWAIPTASTNLPIVFGRTAVASTRGFQRSSRVASPGDSATTKTTTTTSTTTTATHDKEAILKAPFSKVEASSTTGGRNRSGLFPWVSEASLPERLIRGTPDHARKGLLLGGDLTSSNPRTDFFATACFFLKYPFWDLVFFRTACETDLARSMALAFGAAVEEIAKGNTELVTTTTTDQTTSDSEDNIDKNSDSNNDSNTDEENQEPEQEELTSPQLRDMLETTKLAKLFESANEFGRDKIQVKLETTPILSEHDTDRDTGDEDSTSLDHLPDFLRDGPKIVSLFVFPFLTRDQLGSGSKSNPHHVRKYSKFLDAISETNQYDNHHESNNASAPSSLDLSRELMEDFRQQGFCENTIVCQVLVPCLETFWVKESDTGTILQGSTQPQRPVLHLVRFEMVTKTNIVPGGGMFFPFENELGQWKITDIDDLCDGNLLL